MILDRLLGRPWLLATLGAAFLMAAYLWVWDSPDLAELQHWAEEASHHPAVVIGVVLVMGVALTIGLPGSLGLWLIAPFYPPLAAAPMLVVGSVGGAIGAYHLSACLGDRLPTGGHIRRMMRHLERRSDFLTQCALRILPGFPHSVVNFAAGLLRLPLGTFVIAAVVGLGIKWAIYASAIYAALGAVERDEALGANVMLPLLALAMLLLIGGWVQRRIAANAQAGS